MKNQYSCFIIFTIVKNKEEWHERLPCLDQGREKKEVFGKEQNKQIERKVKWIICLTEI